MSSLSRRRALVAMAPATALLLAACSGPAGRTRAEEPATRLVDSERGEVEIPASPQAIACVDWQMPPAMVELGVPPTSIYEGYHEDGAVLGVPERYIDALAEADRFGAWDAMSAESILESDPDLIVTAGVGLEEGDYTQLEQIAPLVVLPTGGTWRSLQGRLAEILGKEDEFAVLGTAYDEKAQRIHDEHADALEQLRWVSISGGAEGQWFVEGGLTPSGSLITALGGAFSDEVEAEGFWSEPRSLESIGDLADADVILYPVDYEGRAVAGIVPMLEQELFQQLPAQRAGNVHGFRHGNVSSLEWAGAGLEELGEILAGTRL